MLLADPFAANSSLNPATSTQFDPVLEVGSTAPIQIDYQPGDGESGPVCTPYTAEYSSTSSNGQTAQQTYTVSTSASASALIAGLKISDTYKYTNMASSKTITAASQSAMLNVCTPAAADLYGGPTTLLVFKDNIYGTFLFYGP
jgi:hypothetical protein